MKSTPTWENTFNSSFVSYSHVSKALDAAALGGYPFMAWNRRVYRLKKTYSAVALRDLNDGEDTGILVEDLK